MRKAILLLSAALAALAQQPGLRPAEELTLTAGRTLVVDYATDVSRISTSNPEVVDAVAVSTREVLLNAKSPGAATVIIWSKGGPRTQYGVAVEPNLEPVRALLKSTFPEADVRVHAARDSLSLTGTVPTQATGERAAALMAPFAKVVVNNLRVVSAAPEKQILLRVKIAELNRTASVQLGFNLVQTGAGNTIGSIGTGQFSAVHPSELQAASEGSSAKFTISDALNIFAFRPDLNLGMFIKALQSRGVLQILAEPNLVASNGKEASFLAGGEFPVPIVQGGANAGAVTIVFKEFGIRLTFQPTITEHGTIRMTVKPEVSTIDLGNAVLYSGFTIPALATRRIETSLELGEGQSFVIAGLIDDRVVTSLSKIPGLANIPLLGALFKSRQDQKSSTELVVIVAPEITNPVARSEVKPHPMPEQFLAPYMTAPTPPARGSEFKEAPRK
jgi:pilus assembly protein CpaC